MGYFPKNAAVLCTDCAWIWCWANPVFFQEATANLTRFVFYFALSAMIFRFAANLEFDQVLSWNFVAAYLSASITSYLVAALVALWRKIGLAQVAVEAQCAVVGNVGFLGIPMLVLLLGEQSVGPVMVILTVDLVIFGGLLVIMITIAREGKINATVFWTIAKGLCRNPMIVSIALGMA